MPQFIAVTSERHAVKQWHRYTSYGFARAETTAPVVGIELAQAALSMPLAFTEQAGRHTLVAVLSVAPGCNQFVTRDGRWLGGYVPAWFRSYPFCAAATPGTDHVALYVDEASGLITDPQPGGETFFDSDGKLSPTLQQMLGFLTQLERSRRATEAAVSTLTEVGVIQPWPITVKTERDEQAFSGLHRIDEAALNALSDEAFSRVRKVLALPIIYAQLLSTAQIGIFSQLAKLQAQSTSRPPSLIPESLDSIFSLSNDDTIRFR